jgi:hypothetical protein
MQNNGVVSSSSAGPIHRALNMLSAAIVLLGAVLWCSRGVQVEKTDFSLTYVGAHIVHTGNASRLYDITYQKQIRDSLFRDPNPLFYEHPPFEALLLSPLAAVPFRTAYMIWGILNAMVWLLLVFFLRRYLVWPDEELGYIALWLLFAPLGVALFQGQSSLLVLAIFSIGFVRLKKREEFSAGLALGLALFKLQFVLPFALLMLFRRKWGFLRGFACTSLFLGAVSIATVGWKGVMGYAHFLLTIGNNPQNLSFGSAVDMPTIHGFFYAIFGEILGHSALNFAVLAVSFLLLWFVAQRWNSVVSDSADTLAFAAAVPACLLASSHMFTHDFSPLLLSMFFVGANLSGFKRRGQGHRELQVALKVILILFWTFPIYFICVAWHCLYLMCPILTLFVFLAMVNAKYIDDRLHVELKYVTA